MEMDFFYAGILVGAIATLTVHHAITTWWLTRAVRRDRRNRLELPVARSRGRR